MLSLDVLTINRVELTAFHCLLRRIVGPITAHVDDKGIIDGLRRGEMQCIDPKANDADLWILIWEEVHRLHQEGPLLEVEHAKAHRSMKEKQEMTLFGLFVKEGTDELAKDGAVPDGGDMAQIRASTVQQKRKEAHAALQYAASLRCVLEEWHDCEDLKPKPKDNWTSVDKKKEASRHRTEWCAATRRCRCRRCGRSSIKMKYAREV